MDRNRNAVTLAGTLIAVDNLRYTPAGLPLASFKLAHESVQNEAGVQRKVECEIDGIAIGDLAPAIAAEKSGNRVILHGFLARKDRMNPKLILHLTHIEKDHTHAT